VRHELTGTYGLTGLATSVASFTPRKCGASNKKRRRSAGATFQLFTPPFWQAIEQDPEVPQPTNPLTRLLVLVMMVMMMMMAGAVGHCRADWNCRDPNHSQQNRNH